MHTILKDHLKKHQTGSLFLFKPIPYLTLYSTLVSLVVSVQAISDNTVNISDTVQLMHNVSLIFNITQVLCTLHMYHYS